MEYCDKDSLVCVHKGLFNPKMYGSEIWGLISITFLMLLCTAGGIGGGVVVAPMCIAFFEFGTREAVAISGFCVLICQITKLIYSWKQKHPEKDTKAIDYGLATVMLPTVLLGSFIGTFVTILVPPIILQILLTALLTFLTVQSALKAKEIY